MNEMFEKEFLNQRNKEKSKHLSKFFKTGKGQYGEGDIFLGLTVPQTREIVKKFYKNYPISEIEKLLKSPYHEIRLGALLMLVKQYEQADETIKKKIYNTYIKNVKCVNNWDLVDLTAPNIVGHYVYHYGSTKDLFKLAETKNLWAERVSIVASWYLIKHNSFDYTLEICEKSLDHNHDLIHKATGWMLREVGKKDNQVLCEFLDKNAQYMPRTALRYAIERFDEKTRKSYLAIKKLDKK